MPDVHFSGGKGLTSLPSDIAGPVRVGGLPPATPRPFPWPQAPLRMPRSPQSAVEECLDAIRLAARHLPSGDAFTVVRNDGEPYYSLIYNVDQGPIGEIVPVLRRMKPGDRVIIERHREEPGKSLFTLDIRTRD